MKNVTQPPKPKVSKSTHASPTTTSAPPSTSLSVQPSRKRGLIGEGDDIPPFISPEFDNAFVPAWGVRPEIQSLETLTSPLIGFRVALLLLTRVSWL